MNVFICQMCKEPVTNFICPNRLAMSIRDWLPDKLTGKFSKFHSTLMSYFSSDRCDFRYQRSHCETKNILCTEKDQSRLCAFCYIAEVYEWLKNNNKSLAEQFLQVFSLGYQKVRYRLEGKIVRHPIIETDLWKTDSGICDECGEYSDELKRNNGEWICNACHHGD